MIDYDNVCFNIAAFVAGLFVLEFGADKFVDHTAKVAARLRIPPTLIALLTAGAEWEELVVVVAAISQRRSPLAAGNILGSSISNILGAFSLGLISAPSTVIFDRSSQIYTAALLALTTLFVVIATFVKPLGRAGGGILVATFTAYISSIAWAIYKGVVKPPEDSDSDSDSDSNSSDHDGAEEEEGEEEEVKDVERSTPRSSSSTTLRDLSAPADHHPSESIPLAREMFDAADLKPTPDSALQTQTHHRRRPRSTTYHVVHLILGFLALSLSGYVLSHSISTLAETFSLAGSVLGITLLSLATTLPEKLVAVFSGARQQPGIMVANTAGSNIFLVTLCAGVLFLAADLDALAGSLTPFELLSMWAASLLLFVIVMVGGRSWMGWASFALYLAFIICEFTANRR